MEEFLYDGKEVIEEQKKSTVSCCTMKARQSRICEEIFVGITKRVEEYIINPENIFLQYGGKVISICMGVILPSNSIIYWVIRCIEEWCSSSYARIHPVMLRCRDDVSIQCNKEEEKKATSDYYGESRAPPVKI